MTTIQTYLGAVKYDSDLGVVTYKNHLIGTVKKGQGEWFATGLSRGFKTRKSAITRLLEELLNQQ